MGPMLYCGQGHACSLKQSHLKQGRNATADSRVVMPGTACVISLKLDRPVTAITLQLQLNTLSKQMSLPLTDTAPT